jgi:outer membrane receptor protein involved in Fe transport
MKIFEPTKFRQKRMFTEGLQRGPLVILSLLLAAAIVAFTPLNAQAQAETGIISGEVKDPNGAVIAGAKIKIVNVGTGAERNATSDANGNYVATNLLPALYEISVEASGFSVNKTRAQVTVGSKVTVDFQLVVGGTQQVVEVVAGAGVQVNTETQTVAEVIDGKKITELPTVTRNPYDFVITAGNVSPGDPANMTQRGVGVAINGLRSAGTNILLDGAANNDEFTAGVGQTVPLDSVQEYSIITNNFTAEFGRASGGIVNLATKSGTNDYHGTAYQFGRYSRLNSNSFQNNANGLPKSVYTRNQFGYSIGGPVIKEKLFFFQSTEFLRVRSTDTPIVVVPTPQFIALANSATRNFFNTFGTLKTGIIPLGTLSRQSFLNAGANDPCAVTDADGNVSISPVCDARTTLTTPLFNRIAYSVPSDSGGGNPQNTYNLVGRVDYNLSAKTQLYGRYALDRSKQFDGSVSNSPYQGFDTGQRTTNNSFVLSVTHTFSPQLILQSKGVFNRLNTLQPQGTPSPTLFWQDARTTRFLGDLAALPGYLPFAPGSGIPFGGPQNFVQTYQDLNYTKGQHNFRFGGSYVYIQDNRTFGAYQDPSAGLGTTSLNIDNFLLGQLQRFQGAIDPQGKFPCANPAAPDPSCTISLPLSQPNFSRSNLYHEFAFYGQDSWRISPRLTLNLGLRYEYFGVQHNKNSALDSNYYDADNDNIFQAIRNGVAATGRGLWEKDLNNFAPRVGFAYDVFGDGKTSFRGGYGIGYERNFGNVTFNVIQNPPNYAVIILQPSNTAGGVVPLTNSVFGPLSGASGTRALPNTSLRNVDSKIRTAYAHLYSITLEREVARNLVVALDYNGSNGRKLYSIEDPNRLGFGNVFLGDPLTGVNNGLGSRLRTTQFNALNRRGGKGFSNYSAFNARVNINNFANSGLRMTVNYTWSHAQDNLSSTFSESANNFNLGLLDPFNPGLDYGNADFDLRQRLVFSGTWDIPFAKDTKGYKKQILDGWELAPIFTANTGTPFSFFDCANAVTVCARISQLSALPRKGSGNSPQDPSTPGQFTYLDLSGLIGDPFANPITGTTEVGPYSPSMIGRNFFRGPGSWNTDLGIYKNFRLTEQFKLQYRAEFFNLFNHSNASILGSELDSSSQSVVRTQKDGRRNIQMALKLIF